MDAVTLVRVDQALFYAWPVAEFVLGRVRRAGGGTAEVRDRGSLVAVWIAIFVSIMLAMFARYYDPGSLRLSPMTRAVVALVLLVAGLALRTWAIVTLGKFFTVNVAVHADHRVVRNGPYRWLRHPSYTGALIAFVGLGILTGSALSLGVLAIGIGAAFAYRIAVEERALREHLGAEYDEYACHTRRLIPFVY